MHTARRGRAVRRTYPPQDAPDGNRRGSDLPSRCTAGTISAHPDDELLSVRAADRFSLSAPRRAQARPVCRRTAVIVLAAFAAAAAGCREAPTTAIPSEPSHEAPAASATPVPEPIFPGGSPLKAPAGLAASAAEGSDRLYVGDPLGGVQVVLPEAGVVEATAVEPLEPARVAVRGDRIVTVSEASGVVRQLDRATFEVLAAEEGFERPGDALLTPDGELIVAESGSGRVLRIVDASAAGRRQVVAAGLDRPNGLAWAGDGRVYVTETGGGRLLRIAVATGETVIEAAELDRPEGVAVGPAGEVYVVEVGARRIVRLAPRDGTVSIVAEDLPIGAASGPSLYRGIAVGTNALYFSSELDHTIYRLPLR